MKTLKTDRRELERRRDHEYYYSMMNPDIEESLNYEQKDEIKNLLKRAVRVPSRKIIDFRTTFWFIKKLYIVVFIGFDKRDEKNPVKMDGYVDKPSIIRFGLKFIVYGVQIIILLLAIIFIIYLLQSLTETVPSAEEDVQERFSDIVERVRNSSGGMNP